MTKNQRNRSSLERIKKTCTPSLAQSKKALIKTKVVIQINKNPEDIQRTVGQTYRAMTILKERYFKTLQDINIQNTIEIEIKYILTKKS